MISTHTAYFSRGTKNPSGFPLIFSVDSELWFYVICTIFHIILFHRLPFVLHKSTNMTITANEMKLPNIFHMVNLTFLSNSQGMWLWIILYKVPLKKFVLPIH